MTKEIIMMILFLVLIILIAVVSVYDYIPSTIAMPEQIEYSTDSLTTSVLQEIAFSNGGDNSTDDKLINELKSYSIDSADLSVYGEKNLYTSGNSNPFEYVQEEEPVAENPGEGQQQGTPAPATGTTTPNTNTTTAPSNTVTSTTNTAVANPTTPATSSGTVENSTVTAPASGTATTTGTFFEKPGSK